MIAIVKKVKRKNPEIINQTMSTFRLCMKLSLEKINKRINLSISLRSIL